jgi:NADH-quinone oxidoreductase subunit K
MIGIGHYIGLSAILLGIGMIGVITRRNLLVIFMSVELMLNSVNLLFAAFAYYNWNLTGHVFGFMVMVVAACEAAVGLGIILGMYRNRATSEVDEINLMKW